MHGFAITLALACLVCDHDSIEIPKDALEFTQRDFEMPLHLTGAEQVSKLRFFVSVDEGKTWKHVRDYDPTDKAVRFTAPQDGLYWFAVQIVLKDGTASPPQIKNLNPSQKVYVNTKRRALKPAKTKEEIRGELKELRKERERLQKRIHKLESRLANSRRMEPASDN